MSLYRKFLQKMVLRRGVTAPFGLGFLGERTNLQLYRRKAKDFKF